MRRLMRCGSTCESGRVEFKLFGRAAGSPVVIETVEQARELRWLGGPKGLLKARLGPSYSGFNEDLKRRVESA